MLYKNLTTKELYSSIPATSIIAQFFEIGLEIGSAQLAVSAMEELMVRGDTDIIATKLQSASDKGQLRPGTSITGMIARSLVENREDPILHKYGKIVLRGGGNEGIFKWIQTPEAEQMFQSERLTDKKNVLLAKQELLQQQEAKNERRVLTDNSAHDWVREAVVESFEPQGFEPPKH